MEALAGNHTEALHGHEGRIVLLEEDSSRTHFILGAVDRRLIELERDIPPQEGDSGVPLREGHQLRRLRSRRNIWRNWKLRCRSTKWRLSLASSQTES